MGLCCLKIVFNEGVIVEPCKYGSATGHKTRVYKQGDTIKEDFYIRTMTIVGEHFLW